MLISVDTDVKCYKSESEVCERNMMSINEYENNAYVLKLMYTLRCYL